jgi:hypothetical protein
MNIKNRPSMSIVAEIEQIEDRRRFEGRGHFGKVVITHG